MKLLLGFILLSIFICIKIVAATTDADGDSNSLVVRVAMLQMMPSATQNQTENTAKAIEFCEKAAAAGADIALFPELWNVGYTIAYGGYNRSDPTAHLNWLRSAVSVCSLLFNLDVLLDSSFK